MAVVHIPRTEDDAAIRTISKAVVHPNIFNVFISQTPIILAACAKGGRSSPLPVGGHGIASVPASKARSIALGLMVIFHVDLMLD